jgi:hypothetical protein
LWWGTAAEAAHPQSSGHDPVRVYRISKTKKTFSPRATIFANWKRRFGLLADRMAGPTAGHPSSAVAQLRE